MREAGVKGFMSALISGHRKPPESAVKGERKSIMIVEIMMDRLLDFSASKLRDIGLPT